MNSLPFPELIGQDRIRIDLAKTILEGRLAHSYIISGAAGTGRMAMAMELARVLNCSLTLDKALYENCYCNHCKNIRKWNHPNLMPLIPMPNIEKTDPVKLQEILDDFIKIKSENAYLHYTPHGTGNILVDSIRELRGRLSYMSDVNSMRVIVIFPATAMVTEAANALLKLLEEPPDRCIFILITDTLRSLMPTILSRCQVINLQLLTREEIANALISRKLVDRVKAHQTARISFGSYGNALEILEDDTEKELEKAVGFLRALLTKDAEKIYSIAEEYNKNTNRQGLKKFYKCVEMWLQDALIWKSFDENTAMDKLYNYTNHETIMRMANKFTFQQLEQGLRELSEGILEIDSNVLLNLSVITMSIRLKEILK